MRIGKTLRLNSILSAATAKCGTMEISKAIDLLDGMLNMEVLYAALNPDANHRQHRDHRQGEGGGRGPGV